MDAHRMIADMALELEDHRTPQETLDKVSQYARAITDADDAGIMLMRSRRDIVTAAATTTRVDDAHQLQAKFDEGPCLDAIEGRATYVTEDTEADERWPRWGPAAAEIGIHSAIGVRLATRARGYGSLNVYANRKGAFDGDSVTLIQLLAAHATAAVAASERETGLTEALETRTTIGQAQGILMQQFDMDAGRAFEFLRRMSQDRNLRLNIVAEAIVQQREANIRPVP